MTALDFQSALGAEIANLLNNIQTEDVDGDKKSGVTIFDQQLPEITEDEEDSSQFFPYAIVRISDGKTEDDDTPWIVTADILIGIHDRDKSGAGYKKVMEMCQKIVDRFSAEPLLDKKYRALQNMEWALQDEDTYPFYFGGIRMQFYLPRVGRRDPFYG